MNNTFKRLGRCDELLFFNDVETSGFDPIRNAMLSTCFIVTDNKYDIKEEITLEIAPYKGDQLHDKALAINGFTISQILGFMPPPEAADTLIKFLLKFRREDKRTHRFIYHAQGNFDWKFNEWFLRKGDRNQQYDLWKVLQGNNTESTLSMARDILKIKNQKELGLKALAKSLNIEFNEKDHHTARFDTFTCMKIHKTLTEIDHNAELKLR